jgi:transposase
MRVRDTMRPSQRNVLRSLRRRQKSQSPLWIASDERAQSAGHRFDETRNALLREAAFDRNPEDLCTPYDEAAQVPERKSVAPGVYVRIHLGDFFEGIESERGREWRCAESLCVRSWGARSRSACPITRR